MRLKEENIPAARKIFLDAIAPVLAAEPNNEAFLQGEATTFSVTCSTYALALIFLGAANPGKDVRRQAAEKNLEAFDAALSQQRAELAAEPNNEVLRQVIRYFETVRQVLPQILATLGGFELDA